MREPDPVQRAPPPPVRSSRTVRRAARPPRPARPRGPRPRSAAGGGIPPPASPGARCRRTLAPGDVGVDRLHRPCPRTRRRRSARPHLVDRRRPRAGVQVAGPPISRAGRAASPRASSASSGAAAAVVPGARPCRPGSRRFSRGSARGSAPAARDPARAVPRVEVEADQVGVVLVVDPVVGGDDEPRARVLRPGELLEGQVPVPLVLRGPAGDGGGALPGAADREPPRALVADRPSTSAYTTFCPGHESPRRAWRNSPKDAARTSSMSEEGSSRPSAAAHRSAKVPSTERTRCPRRRPSRSPGSVRAGSPARRTSRPATPDLDRLRTNLEGLPGSVELGRRPPRRSGARRRGPGCHRSRW